MQMACRVDGCGRPLLVKKSRLCRLHYHRVRSTGSAGTAERRRVDGNPKERWLAFVRPESPGCWIWTGVPDKHGYGQFGVTEGGKSRNWRAHRWVYTQLVRELASDETLDHLCRVHACVNPDHLDPVSQSVNSARGYSPLALHARKTHCPRGHEYDAVDNRGGRYCRRCENDAQRARYAARRDPSQVHNRDKTHCKHGHEFTPENTRLTKQGRQCIQCTRTYMREYNRKLRGTAPDAVPNGQKTHCKHGHEFSPANTYMSKAGSRICATCARASQQRHRAKVAAMK